MSLHSLHHMSRNFKLWHMNQRLARQLMRKNITQQYGEYTLTIGNVKHLKEIERLHMSLFREPMLNWLVWLYRFRASNLLSVALNAEGKVVGYECFMFNEAEIEDRILHEVYVGVSEEGKGIATALRKFSLETFNFGNICGISTVAGLHDIKALRSAQKAGFAITKQSLKPPGNYLFKALSLKR